MWPRGPFGSGVVGALFAHGVEFAYRGLGGHCVSTIRCVPAWSIVTSRIECPRDERGISYQPWKSGVRRHFVSRFPAPTARYCKRRKGSILYLSPFAMSDVLGDSLSSSCRRSALP